MKFYPFYKGRSLRFNGDGFVFLKILLQPLANLSFNRNFMMRFNLTIVIMILALIQVSANSYGQMITIKEKNASLKSIFQKIKSQSEIDFVYNPQMLEEAKPIDIDLKNTSIETVLAAIFKDQPLSYTIDQGVVVVRRKSDYNPGSPSKNIQQSQLSGRITDKNNMPIVGVSIQVKGTQTGTTSNSDGRFTLDVSPGTTLVFTMLGYQKIEKTVDASLSMQVEMELSSTMIGEVQINTGFQTIDKKLFTGAATSISGADVKTEGAVDVSRMLEGRVAGVSVQNVSGTFGSAPKLRIRGATSITGDNKPLWVIDGVVLEDIVNISNDQLSSGDALTLIGSSVAGINAEDIATFEILKDASATALYGARAMNGVVVITTKKGRSGAPSVTYTANFSTYLKPSYSDFNIMNSADQMSVYAEMSRKGLLNFAPALRKSNGGVYTKMYNNINTYDEATGQYLLENTTEAREQFLKRYALANTDWFDLLFRNSLVQEHSISISSGTDKARHYFSGSYYDDSGYTIADKVKRFTGNMRSDYNFGEYVTAGVIVNGSIRDQRVPGTLARENDVVRGEYTRNFDINPYSYSLNTSRTLTAYDENGNLEFFTRNFAPFNIIHELENNKIDVSMIDFKIQPELGIKILKNLEYKALGSIRYVKTSRENMITEHSNMSNAYRAANNSSIRDRNNFLYNDPDKPYQERQIVLPEGGFYMRGDDMLKSYYGRHTLQYNTKFADGHRITAFIGQDIRFADRQSAYNNGYGYQYDKGGVPFTDYRIVKQMLEGNFNYFGMENRYDRFVSFFGNMQYDYQSKYVINFASRYDGSNKMGNTRKSRWLPTWTASGAWNIDEENFMQDVSSVSMLKLRGGYGLTANIGNARNSTAIFNNTQTKRPYLSEVESKIEISALENSELTWEKQYEANIGLDLGINRNKFTASIDYFNRLGFELINTVRTSGIGGQSTKAANYANMKSNGIDVTLGAKWIDHSDFNFRSNFTLGYIKNTITDLKSQPRIFDLVIPEGGPKVGGPVRGLYSIKFEGLDPYTGIPNFTNHNGIVNPDVYLQSTNTEHLILEGSVDPKYTGGLSNILGYKGISLNVFVTYQWGNKIRMDRVFKASYSDLDANPREFLDRWTLPGDEKTTNIPSIMDDQTALVLGSIYPYNNYNFSDTRVADGSFVRLKTIAINYLLPQSFSSRLGLNSLNMALNANNIWLIYSDKALKGQDPEFFNAGGVANPMPKQFTFTLKIGI